jgi:hypothetical protein
MRVDENCYSRIVTGEKKWKKHTKKLTSVLTMFSLNKIHDCVENASGTVNQDCQLPSWLYPVLILSTNPIQMLSSIFCEQDAKKMPKVSEIRQLIRSILQF